MQRNPPAEYPDRRLPFRSKPFSCENLPRPPRLTRLRPAQSLFRFQLRIQKSGIGDRQRREAQFLLRSAESLHRTPSVSGRLGRRGLWVPRDDRSESRPKTLSPESQLSAVLPGEAEIMSVNNHRFRIRDQAAVQSRRHHVDCAIPEAVHIASHVPQHPLRLRTHELPGRAA